MSFAAAIALTLASAAGAGTQDFSTSAHETYRTNVDVIGASHRAKLRAAKRRGMSARSRTKPAPTLAICKQRAAARGYYSGSKYSAYMGACVSG